MARLRRKPSHIDSSGTDNPKRVYHYQVIETPLESIARTLVAADQGPFIVTPFGMLFRGDISCNSTAYNQWDVDIEYTPRQKDIGTYEIDYDGTGVTEHVTHCLEDEVGYAVSPVGGVSGGGARTAGQAPSQHRAIGREESGNLQGTDVIRPFAKITVTFTHPAGVATLAYLNYLSDLTGYYNSDSFLGRAPGEVRFMGPRGKEGSNTQSSVSYSFEIQKNRSNFAVGPVTGISKLGWDVGWTISRQSTETVGTDVYPVTIPRFVYTGKVSSSIAFKTAFGFG